MTPRQRHAHDSKPSAGGGAAVIGVGTVRKALAASKDETRRDDTRERAPPFHEPPIKRVSEVSGRDISPV
jgi:hypothetical protein